FKWDEERAAPLAVQSARPVALPRGVFHQEQIAGAEESLLPAPDFDLDCAVQQHDILARRGRMPVEVVVRFGFAKNQAGDWNGGGEPADLAGILQRDVVVLE